MKLPPKFRVHFNRINMQRGNPNVWTVHTSKVCHQVRSVELIVPVQSVFNPNGRQPRAYFSGRGYIEVRDGVAWVTLRRGDPRGRK